MPVPTTINVPIISQALPQGDTLIAPTTVPVGLSKMGFTLDVALLPSTEQITVAVYRDDGDGIPHVVASATRQGGSVIDDDTGLPTTIMGVRETNIGGDPNNAARKCGGKVTPTKSFTSGTGTLTAS